MQIFSIDTQWHLVHPWHQDPLKTCDEGGTQKLISVVLAWSLGRCTDGFCPAAAAAGYRMKRSEVQGRLTAEVRESALLRWGEHDLVPMGVSFLQEGSLGSRHLLVLLLLPLAELHRVLWGVAG